MDLKCQLCDTKIPPAPNQYWLIHAGQTVLCDKCFEILKEKK